MSIKTQFTRILQDVDKRNEETRQKITRICNNPAYSFEGKKAAVEKIQSDTAVYIQDRKAEISTAVDKKIDDINAAEKSELQKRNTSPEYQSLLASTLQMLPAVMGNSDPGALKERLSMFENDPIAITAISNVIRESENEEGSNFKGFNGEYMDVVPKDNRGQKQKRLQQLETTMENHLDAMNYTVQDKAYSGGNAVNIGTVKGGSNVNATLDYIAACEDDDCTIFEDNSLL